MGITLKQLRDAFKNHNICCDCTLPLLPDEQKFGRCESCYFKHLREENRKLQLFLEEDKDGYYDPDELDEH